MEADQQRQEPGAEVMDSHFTSRIAAVLPSQRDWPLHDLIRSREIEYAAIAAHPVGVLMQRAGDSIAKLALALAPHSRQIWVAAGPGNNGGDGLVAATRLHLAGKQVQVTLFGDPDRAGADARTALKAAQLAGVRIDADSQGIPTLAAADLAIDALLGIGASRAPAGAVEQAILAMSALRAPVLAVDLPSGLAPDSGRRLGQDAVRADNTLSLLTLKSGLFTADGRDHAGRVWLDSLGIACAVDDPSAILVGPVFARQAHGRREHGGHKGRYGDCVVIGGARGMRGAAMLAARSALSAGSGRVFLGLLDTEHFTQVDPIRPELMHRPVDELLAPTALVRATVVCGCGGGALIGEVLAGVLTHALRLVLDADALNAVAADGQLRLFLAGRAAKGLPTILTPHPLEAARLLGCTADEVQQNRIDAAKRIAQAFGAVVALKGSGTIIASPAALPMINPTGSARLASAGTGDVLAGWIGGLWSAQAGLTPSTIAAAAVWLHGRAGESGNLRAPLPADELITAMTNCVAAWP
jgi:hydroxyethylthiazole kinase-like uncharacterized protein yjeF